MTEVYVLKIGEITDIRINYENWIINMAKGTILYTNDYKLEVMREPLLIVNSIESYFIVNVKFLGKKVK